MQVNIRKRCCSLKSWLPLVPILILSFVVSLKHIYMSNWEPLLWKKHITPKLSTTSLPLSTLALHFPIHLMYEELGVLFGWDLKSLWQITIQKRCHALLLSGRLGEGLESYRSIMGMNDETTKGSLLAWFADKSLVILPIVQFSSTFQSAIKQE